MSFCPSVGIFHCFLKKDNNFVIGLFRRHYPGGPNVQNCFHTCHSPQGSCFGLFLQIYTYCYFFMLLFCWRTIQLLHISFFTGVVGISLKGASLESPFHSISPTSGSHFEVFWGSFWAMFLYFSRAIPSFCTVDFCITLAVNGLRNILQHLSLCWGYFAGFFWPVVGIFHHALRKIRHYAVVSLLWTFLSNSGPSFNMFLKC